MNNLVIIFVFLVLAINLTFGIYLCFFLHSILKEMKQKRNLEQLKLNLNYEVKDQDFILLDRLIQENMQAYEIYHAEELNKKFISTETQNKMIESLLKTTLEHISPIYLNKLSYIYNVEHIEDIILDKIKLVVINFTVETNNTLE